VTVGLVPPEGESRHTVELGPIINNIVSRYRYLPVHTLKRINQSIIKFGYQLTNQSLAFAIKQSINSFSITQSIISLCYQPIKHYIFLPPNQALAVHANQSIISFCYQPINHQLLISTKLNQAILSPA